MQMRSALPWQALISEHMRMLEPLRQPFELILQCTSTSAHLPLQEVLVERLSLWLLQADGTQRRWHAYVHSAARRGANSGLARYTLELRLWLSALGMRRNSRVSHAMSVAEIIDDRLCRSPSSGTLAVRSRVFAGCACTMHAGPRDKAGFSPSPAGQGRLTVRIRAFGWLAARCGKRRRSCTTCLAQFQRASACTRTRVERVSDTGGGVPGDPHPIRAGVRLRC
jgi:predicted DNA-binding ribbon-helix-helix protein